MGDAANWRTEIDAGDYFLHQKKQLNVADRRPVIRRASDIVGPGIAANAVRITDFNDALATFNGFFSYAPASTLAEPNKDTTQFAAPTDGHAYVGWVSSDAELGGAQVFTNLDTFAVYRRSFRRNPADPSVLYWSSWATL